MDTEEKVFGCFTLLIVFVVLASILISVVGFHYNTGSGQHTGYVTAVQKQGVFFKTWRAYVKTNTQSSQEDMYCVIDENIVKQLQDAAENNRQVTISYIDWLEPGITNCSGETDIINGIIK